MAQTHLKTVDGATVAWTQPKRFISVPVGDNGRGHFVEVPTMDWLGTVAASHGPAAAAVALDAVCDYMASEAKAAANKKDVKSADSADKEREVINAVVTKIANGTYDSGDISGRDDFNRALFAAARSTLENALKARGATAVTEAQLKTAFRANYARAMELFGHDVATAGYAPTKKNVGGTTAAVASTDNLI